jgi:hypothetical protein
MLASCVLAPSVASYAMVPIDPVGLGCRYELSAVGHFGGLYPTALPGTRSSSSSKEGSLA